MPSYTFVSTANAFVLRGGIPVFVDIRPDTLNIDENKIETCITEKTKAIVVVHYAGVVCEMDSILAIAKKYDLIVIEDAAQAIYSKYKGKPAGSFGHMAAFSFHETKNLISGEGGALVLNDSSLIERAEIIREKGTNRSKFFRGQVDKYTWVDLGSSYLPGEITAAFLFAQLENAKAITEKRLQVWNSYHKSFEELETKGITKRPVIPQNCEHNAHMYYFIFPSLDLRQNFINQMKSEGIHCVFHYIPLHSSPAGKQFGRTGSPMTNTDRISNTLVRLPIFCDLLASESSLIINKTIHFLEG
jgi:dTDP-4-amino-4,6-dideoxygalactose transaminase